MSDEELQDPKNADHLAWITDCQYGNMSHLEIAEEMKDKANLIFKGGFQKEGGAQQAANPKLAVTIYDDGICNADLVRRSLSQQRLFLLLLAGHLHFNAKFPPLTTLLLRLKRQSPATKSPPFSGATVLPPI